MAIFKRRGLASRLKVNATCSRIEVTARAVGRYTDLKDDAEICECVELVGPDRDQLDNRRFPAPFAFTTMCERSDVR